MIANFVALGVVELAFAVTLGRVIADRVSGWVATVAVGLIELVDPAARSTGGIRVRRITAAGISRGYLLRAASRCGFRTWCPAARTT
jgi:hypothetical protein